MASPAPIPNNEVQRLKRLWELGILDSDAEPAFDALTRAAALLTGAPIALITLVDSERQWFKSNIGLEGTTQTPRDAAFCAYTILDDQPFVVADALKDPRFADNPLVADAPHIRFYAGVPLTLHDGLRMGALCVIDRRPGKLSPEHAAILKQLARAASEALDLRAAALERSEALHREEQLQKLLVEDRKRLAAILEASQAGTWEWNVQTGEMRFNEQWSRLLGYSSEDLDALSVVTLQDLDGRVDGICYGALRCLIHPDDWDSVDLELRRYLRGACDLFDCEARMLHQDGHWVWMQTKGQIISHYEDSRPMWMYGTVADVSERKNMERRLQESESFLDRTGRVAGVGGWQVDLETNLVTWSDQTCAIHDLPAGHAPSLTEAVEYYEPEARERMQQAVVLGMQEGRGWDLELPMVTAKGRHIWVREVGAVVGARGKPRMLVGAIQDITFRKQATEALQRSERRFRKLFEESLGLMCTHDVNGILLSVNPAAANLLGYSIAQMLGRSFKDIMDPLTHARFDEYLERVIRTGSDQGLLQVIAKDGRQLTWQYHNTLDTEGEEPYVLGHAQDVSERLRYENQLRDQSVRDALTGLLNRRYLQQVSEHLGDRDACGCIVIDLDGFKQVNDTYGHQRGDEVLIGMGQFLTRHVRPGDIVIRSGGDEFLVLLPHAGEVDIAAVVHVLDDHRADAPIGFTLGYAMRVDGCSLEAAIELADQHLYQARRDRGYLSRSA